MKLCNQCNHVKDDEAGAFAGRIPGRVYQDCSDCRAKYRGWATKTLAEKLAARGPRAREATTGRVTWVGRSLNPKVGPIPVSISDRGTCPPSCALFDAGCYSDYGPGRRHWLNVPEHGLPWPDLLARVRALPPGQPWRHNVAGDLAGQGEEVDLEALEGLVLANRGRRGWTYTHKRSARVGMLAWAASEGFTINLSCDTVQDADAARAAGLPAVVTLAHDAPRRARTPDGHHIVVCPAEVEPGVSCADCLLCAQAERKSVVGFRAHGQFKTHVPELVQLRRQEARGG